MHNQVIEGKGKRDRRTDVPTDVPTDMCKAIYPHFFQKGGIINIGIIFYFPIPL